jgi:23S rRNA pseudouridine2604 synthase
LQTDSISLNKFISDTGYCSRREADNLITKGRVLLNNKPAKLGNRYKPGDSVEVDGSLVTSASQKKKKEKLIYIAFNKPVGVTTTTEENIRGNIITYINHPKRIFPIGRLDKDSEGLIFLTNDGDIVNKILRAGNNHEKEYIVKVNKPIEPFFIQKMAAGVRIKDGTTKPCIVKSISKHTFRIVLKQGMNRQIRKMCEVFDYTVMSLQRVRIMHIKLKDIAVGKWRYLSDVEVADIMEMVKDSRNSE